MPFVSFSMATASFPLQYRSPYATFAKWPLLDPTRLAKASRSSEVRVLRKSLRVMIPEYHHTGVAESTPFGDFPSYEDENHNTGMVEKANQQEIQDGRRAKLVSYIRANFPSQTHTRGNVSAFADAIGKRQSQIADVLDKRKPFGEKLARGLEDLVAEKLMPLGMPELRFDIGREAIQMFYGVPLTREAVEFAADWVKLRGSIKAAIRDLVKNSQPAPAAKADAEKKPSPPVRLQRRKGS